VLSTLGYDLNGFSRVEEAGGLVLSRLGIEKGFDEGPTRKSLWGKAYGAGGWFITNLRISQTNHGNKWPTGQGEGGKNWMDCSEGHSKKNWTGLTVNGSRAISKLLRGD